MMYNGIYIYVYIYMYMYIYIYVYMNIYIYAALWLGLFGLTGGLRAFRARMRSQMRMEAAFRAVAEGCLREGPWDVLRV